MQAVPGARPPRGERAVPAGGPRKPNAREERADGRSGIPASNARPQASYSRHAEGWLRDPVRPETLAPAGTSDKGGRGGGRDRAPSTGSAGSQGERPENGFRMSRGPRHTPGMGFARKRSLSTDLPVPEAGASVPVDLNALFSMHQHAPAAPAHHPSRSGDAEDEITKFDDEVAKFRATFATAQTLVSTLRSPRKVPYMLPVDDFQRLVKNFAASHAHAGSVPLPAGLAPWRLVEMPRRDRERIGEDRRGEERTHHKHKSNEDIWAAPSSDNLSQGTFNTQGQFIQAEGSATGGETGSGPHSDSMLPAGGVPAPVGGPPPGLGSTINQFTQPQSRTSTSTKARKTHEELAREIEAERLARQKQHTSKVQFAEEPVTAAPVLPPVAAVMPSHHISAPPGLLSAPATNSTSTTTLPGFSLFAEALTPPPPSKGTIWGRTPGTANESLAATFFTPAVPPTQARPAPHTHGYVDPTTFYTPLGVGDGMGTPAFPSLLQGFGQNAAPQPGNPAFQSLASIWNEPGAAAQPPKNVARSLFAEAAVPLASLGGLQASLPAAFPAFPVHEPTPFGQFPSVLEQAPLVTAPAQLHASPLAELLAAEESPEVPSVKPAPVAAPQPAPVSVKPTAEPATTTAAPTTAIPAAATPVKAAGKTENMLKMLERSANKTTTSPAASDKSQAASAAIMALLQGKAPATKPGAAPVPAPAAASGTTDASKSGLSGSALLSAMFQAADASKKK